MLFQGVLDPTPLELSGGEAPFGTTMGFIALQPLQIDLFCVDAVLLDRKMRVFYDLLKAMADLIPREGFGEELRDPFDEHNSDRDGSLCRK
jgi:hypothetical protein